MNTDTTTREETCASCRHWKSSTTTEGECRRRPPQAIVFNVGGDEKVVTRFPATSSDDWCGEFEK